MLKNRRKRTITLPFALDKMLERKAKEENRTVSNLIETVLLNYLNEEKEHCTH